MRKKLLIIGASGHGKVVADIALKMDKWQEIAFLDDKEAIQRTIGLKVIGKTEDALIYKDDWDLFVAVGNNKIREKLQNRLENQGASIATLIHPDAVIGAEVELGIGTVIMAGVVINSSTKVGNGCIINTGATIDHDNQLGEYIHISPGVNLAGTVSIGKGSWIGIGSVVSNNVSICKACIVGAGAVVVEDITDQGTYVGVPVRKLVDLL